jgi:hypothetical protein
LTPEESRLKSRQNRVEAVPDLAPRPVIGHDTSQKMKAEGGLPQAEVATNDQLAARPPLIHRTTHVLPAASSLMAALAWVGLSWWHPTVTYHLGPLIVAAAWPVLLRARIGHQVGSTEAVVSALGGLVLAAIAVGIAATAHLLEGPTLIDRSSATIESVLTALIGGAWGLRVASRRRRAWFLLREGPQ